MTRKQHSQKQETAQEGGDDAEVKKTCKLHLEIDESWGKVRLDFEGSYDALRAWVSANT